MPTLTAPDGTELAYRTSGSGEPLLCLPGGPMQDSRYLAGLGGLSAYRRLVLLDLRGTGRSSVPADPATYRWDRQIADVEAVRAHLGMPAVDLLGHSAGVNLAVGYLAAHPDRVRTLVLVTPSTLGVGIPINAATRLAAARLRHGEPWYPDAFAALEAITEGRGEDWAGIAPFFYGRWDDTAREHRAAQGRQTNAEAAAIFNTGFDPDRVRAALATYPGRVLLVAGEVDLGFPASLADEFAGLFPRASVVVQPAAGHFPWQDDADRFTSTVAGFLDD